MKDNNKQRHLLSIEQLPLATIETLLNRAQQILDSKAYTHQQSQLLAENTVATLFFEPSTRTQVSFSLAAKRLGAEVVTLDCQQSATRKGESLLDTVLTLQALCCDTFIVRHQQNDTPAWIAEHVEANVRVINAGDGTHAHPSQALLDALTIRQVKSTDFSSLRIAIIGDIRHSRVANSQLALFSKLGVNDIRLAAPDAMLPSIVPKNATLYSHIDEAISGADVIIMLRIQRERLAQATSIDADDYHQQFGLTQQRLSLAKPDAIVLHPGPMNRGIEITTEVADGPQSLIQTQVRCGLAMRMAILGEKYA